MMYSNPITTPFTTPTMSNESHLTSHLQGTLENSPQREVIQIHFCGNFWIRGAVAEGGFFVWGNCFFQFGP